MSELNTKQKKLIQEWFNALKEENNQGLSVFDVATDDRFDYDLFQTITEINDFETINSAINNYIHDLSEGAKE